MTLCTRFLEFYPRCDLVSPPRLAQVAAARAMNNAGLGQVLVHVLEVEVPGAAAAPALCAVDNPRHAGEDDLYSPDATEVSRRKIQKIDKK